MKSKFYLIGEGHKEFLADKTKDLDYYVLALAAIARELNTPKNDLRQNQNCGRSSLLLGQWSAGRVQGLSLAEQSRGLLVQNVSYHVEIVGVGCVPTGLCGGGRPAF